MQGIRYQRPSGAADRFLTKKALKQQAAAHPETLILNRTSVAEGEHDGLITSAPDGEFHVVGPDENVKRNWYATLTKRTRPGGGIEVIVR